MGDFSLAFQNIATKSIKKTENIIRATVFDLTSAIIQDTPVDTGRLRANWLVSFNTPIDAELDLEDKSGRTTTSKAKRLITNNKVPLVYWIQNNLPYTNVIEFGLYPKNPKTGTRYEIRDRDKFVIETGFVQLSENGYSKKAPSGMVRINVLKFNKFLQANLKGL
jgi:hypothetical protein